MNNLTLSIWLQSSAHIRTLHWWCGTSPGGQSRVYPVYTCRRCLGRRTWEPFWSTTGWMPEYLGACTTCGASFAKMQRPWCSSLSFAHLRNNVLCLTWTSMIQPELLSPVESDFIVLRRWRTSRWGSFMNAAVWGRTVENMNTLHKAFLPTRLDSVLNPWSHKAESLLFSLTLMKTNLAVRLKEFISRDSIMACEGNLHCQQAFETLERNEEAKGWWGGRGNWVYYKAKNELKNK